MGKRFRRILPSPLLHLLPSREGVERRKFARDGHCQQPESIFLGGRKRKPDQSHSRSDVWVLHPGTRGNIVFTNHWSSPSVRCVWKPPQLQGCVIPPLYCGRPHIYKSFNWSLICCFLLTLKYSGCWQPLSSWLSESESFYLCYYKGVESGRGPVWNDLMK